MKTYLANLTITWYKPFERQLQWSTYTLQNLRTTWNVDGYKACRKSI